MMYRPVTAPAPDSRNTSFLIDSDFDSFELNYDLETDLREAEGANFYHDELELKE